MMLAAIMAGYRGRRVAPTAAAPPADFYVDAAAANDSGSGTSGSPKKFIQSGMALMNGLSSKTLLVKNGTYSNSQDQISTAANGRGSVSGYNRIIAETDGGVVSTRAISLTGTSTNHYLQVEGFSFLTGTSTSTIEGKRLKIMRCGFKGGPTSGNTMNLLIGTNNATPGAEYILVEDCWIYGLGGRYGVLVYNSDKIVLRRVVARHQSGWSDGGQGDPQACIAVYNSVDVESQNCICIDTPSMLQFEKAFYHPCNSRQSLRMIERGCIIVGCDDVPGFGWDDGGAAQDNEQWDCVVVGSQYYGTGGGSSHEVAMTRVTGINLSIHGIRDFSGSQMSATKAALLNNAGNNNGVTITDSTTSGTPSTLGILYPVRVEDGSTLKTAGAGGTQRGAQVTTKIGASGTVWGDSGYTSDTGDALWPWPNEDRIKTELAADSAIGFCTGTSIDGSSQTLTKYIWEKLGNQIPSGIYP